MARWAAAAKRSTAPEAVATILFLSGVAHWVANSMASVLRGTGDMKTPGLALVITGAIQIPLTGALTLGWFGVPALGIRGPATAAVIAFAIAVVWMLSRLTGTEAAVRLHWPADRFKRRASMPPSPATASAAGWNTC